MVLMPHLIFQIEAEINAVKAVAEDLCPLKISLDKVVLTSTGVLLGCWQVLFLSTVNHNHLPSTAHTMWAYVVRKYCICLGNGVRVTGWLRPVKRFFGAFCLFGKLNILSNLLVHSFVASLSLQ